MCGGGGSGDKFWTANLRDKVKEFMLIEMEIQSSYYTHMSYAFVNWFCSLLNGLVSLIFEISLSFLYS